ncbi:MAG: class I SAM-dependent methyltransferase [Dehalococcoidales bacterium]|nr:class I SAM-dependent methyltransferase [Dehalococcoidales bacterium]
MNRKIKFIIDTLKHPKLACKIAFDALKQPSLLTISRKAPGLCSISLGWLIYNRVLKSSHKSRNIIEVGAYKGKSTCFLSLAAKKTGRRVKSFELFSGLPTADPVLDPRFRKGDMSSSLEIYESTVSTYGYREIVDLVVGDARQTLPSEIEDFCVAFLDVDVYDVTVELLSFLIKISQANHSNP